MKDIEKLSNKKEILKEIKEQNKMFNIKDFYLNKGDGAVAVITPKQTIYNYSKIEHGNVVEKIYDQLYPDFEKFDIEKNGTWQQESLNMGNINIQLCSGCSTIVWVPEQINEQQLQSLTQFVNEVKNINMLLEEQGKPSIEFDSNLNDEKNIENILQLSQKHVEKKISFRGKEKDITNNRFLEGIKNIIGENELKSIAESGKNERDGAKEFIKNRIKNITKGER